MMSLSFVKQNALSQFGTNNVTNDISTLLNCLNCKCVFKLEVIDRLTHHLLGFLRQMSALASRWSPAMPSGAAGKRKVTLKDAKRREVKVWTQLLCRIAAGLQCFLLLCVGLIAAPADSPPPPPPPLRGLYGRMSSRDQPAALKCLPGREGPVRDLEELLITERGHYVLTT